MAAKWVPENKTFLYVIIAIIVGLVAYKLYQSIPSAHQVGEANLSVTVVQSLVAREMAIRQRHTELNKTVRAWEACFLTGDPRQAGLSMLKYTEAWAKETGLIYESTQLIEPSQGKDQNEVGVVLQGASDFVTLRRFLQRVETASIAVSMTAIRLRADDSGAGRVKYEFTLKAPYFKAQGGQQSE